MSEIIAEHADRCRILYFCNLLIQSAPGKSSQAIPDEQQRGGIFGSGENKGAESGQAGDANGGQGNLEEVSDLESRTSFS